ncbi:probable cytochrome P450 304a1 isoform X2 [Photinus pyralis]|uniref:probable cytochrome P450 304a1 isoform X2 n=1 Tax=Photinus pyralis TaxID=7054 RepID=UPI0012674EE9|nr:probable cytochrome P450 304a1 isoform X2 [Photinus pyralis]
MITSIILVILSTLVYIFVYRLSKPKLENFPPGPPSLPIWGGYWFLLLANYNFTHKAVEVLSRRYKSDLVGIMLGRTPTVLVTGHDLVKETLTRQEFIGRIDCYPNRFRSMGDLLGVIFTSGDYWRQQRRFALRQLRDFGFGRRFPTTEQMLESEVRNLIGQISSNPHPDNHTLVEERTKTFSDDHHGDFLDTYISNMQRLGKGGGPSGSFNEMQMIWTAIDFFFPSPNVIGPSLNMLWARLCNHPEVQAKIQTEIEQVVGRARLPNLDDRKNMPYTEAVIRESLRIDPVLPINTARRVLEDTTLGGYSLPKGTCLLISLSSANRDRRVWTDPDVFKPERFLDADGNLLKKDIGLSFGGGKRLCPGETFSRHAMFLVLSGLLQNFTFVPVDGAPDPNGTMYGFICDIPPFWVDAVSR